MFYSISGSLHVFALSSFWFPPNLLFASVGCSDYFAFELPTESKAMLYPPIRFFNSDISEWVSFPTPANHVVSSHITAWRLLMWSKYVPVCVVMKTKKRAVIDTSSIYVRGEENLGEWKPRGISLLDEHQSHLDKLERIQEVRAVSHSRLLRFRACASLSDV